MAEARLVEDEEEIRGLREPVRIRNSATDHSEGNKPDHRLSSQGALSSIRAAIRRPLRTSHCNTSRDRSSRRRPEITVVSVEPLSSNPWFATASGEFPLHPPCSEPVWCQRFPEAVQHPPSYEQVIREKRLEENVSCAITPRHAATKTIATQTDVLDNNTSVKEYKSASQSIEEPTDTKNSTVEADQSLATSSLDSTNDPFLSATEPLCASAEPCAPCSVCVEEPTRDFPTNSSLPKPTRPIPRPRTKPNLQLVNREVKVQTLVRFKDDGESALVIPCTAEVSSSSYLSDLLDVFGEGELSQSEQRDDTSESDMCDNDNMSTLHSQRNIRARIQAFENQASMDSGNGAPVTKPEPFPRTQQPNPPAVPIKPAIVPKPTNRGFLEETPAPMPVPSLAPKPQLPPRNAEEENGLGTVTSSMKATALPPSRTSVLARANSLMAQGYQPGARRPTPPVLPKSSLDLGSLTNNTAPLPVSDIPGLDDWETTGSVPAKPLRAVQSIPSGPSVSRKPSVIRVPTCEDEPQDTPFSLPVQWPIGGRVPAVTRKPSITSKPTYQAELQDSSHPEIVSSSVPALSLPPRPIGGKVLPPRPPPAKVGPGRPPPPKTGATHRSSFQAGTSVSTSRQRQSQRTSKQGPVLPPRPNPGHALYNKYTLGVPHGIAEFDYNGTNSGELSFQKNEVLLLLEQIDSNTFECQVGDTRGRVRKSYMKIITPLFNVSGDSDLEVRASTTVMFFTAYLYSESPEELALRVGDTVSNIKEVDSEWYSGTCRGRTGFFPRNYVKVLQVEREGAQGHWKSVENQINSCVLDIPLGCATLIGPRCVARFDFEGEHSDELTFSEGDVIQLKKYVDEEWAEGELGSHAGIFPLNFVEVIEDLPAPPSQQFLPTKMTLPEGEWAVTLYDFTAETDQELTLRQGDRVLVTERVDADWCSGKLHGREGLFPSAFVEFCAALPPAITEGAQRARALYDFSSQCEEELSMKVGDIIIGVESVDHEWFVGELHGQRGLVPKSYIQLL
ncbi:SH3 domain-containing protein 19-like [Scleropages formosus]|uniref:SH3 domain-containing protein 19-like n=1 Tax=Scleropages formosus TaxID=113540 RepID=A0A0P7XYA1_SCLFO|nr:SH3 domain-containing protein 19-like [Scleropages formosus]